MVADIQAALTHTRHNRAGARTILNNFFRAGKPPTSPLMGPLAGSLLLLDLAPGLNQLVELITNNWLPWKGKLFDARAQTGDNIFTRDSRFLLRLNYPFYRGLVEMDALTYRAFQFKTYLAPGLMDPDCTVFKIDYDSPDNPPWTIRRVLDELVEIRSGVYLGKANVHWWWGGWQTVAYFLLERR